MPCTVGEEARPLPSCLLERPRGCGDLGCSVTTGIEKQCWARVFAIRPVPWPMAGVRCCLIMAGSGFLADQGLAGR